MAIKLVCTKKANTAPAGNSELDHVSLDGFGWVEEQTQRTGNTPRAGMYDWIVNKKGKAYVKDSEGDIVYIFGAESNNGEKYIRAAKNGKWTDDLLKLPDC